MLFFWWFGWTQPENAFGRISNSKKVTKSGRGIKGNPALDCSARHDAIHVGWKSKYKPELNF
jgi:hypothetical protein